MLPSAFVWLDRLPLTRNGKVDRRCLPRPGGERPELDKPILAPRDELELQLSLIWERVLGIRSVGREDNFFELGGHSLLAVRLFSEIEKRTGRRLPLATLFEAPTVERLAAVIRQEGWTAPWSSLVAIQPGGTRLPFYCVHPAGGGLLAYRDLARHLGPERPVYGLQAVGLDGARPPLSTVEAMASHYLGEIRGFQPQGPYFLGGYSDGGILAFEIARQLEAAGEPVGCVALLDTWGPGYGELLPASDLARVRARRLLDWFARHSDNLVRAGDLRRRLAYVRDKLSRRLRKTRKVARRPLPRPLQEVRRSVQSAVEKYDPRPWFGSVWLFRAREQPAVFRKDRTLGWNRVVLGGVVVDEVPGNHGSAIREPAVHELAQKLARRLREAEEEAEKQNGQADGAAPAGRIAWGGG
jgi:thioesterase domain-containing protein/acyl carrier protein